MTQPRDCAAMSIRWWQEFITSPWVVVPALAFFVVAIVMGFWPR